MKQNEILQKLVSLLGRSENDPEVIEILTELGVKLPLKKPKRSEDGYLIKLNSPKLYLGVKLQQALPILKNREKLKENELIFTSIMKENQNFENILFPFGVAFGISLDEAKNILGDYFDKRDIFHKYLWLKNDIVIVLSFDEQGLVDEIVYRLIFDFDLANLDKKI